MSSGKCFTTDHERSFLAKNDYKGYYAAACSSGDTYACQAGEIASGKTPAAILTTARLSEFLHDAGVDVSKQNFDDIRLKLANAHADYLRSSMDTSKVLSASAIAEYHWKVFYEYNLPPRAFGGKPFGTTGGTMFEKNTHSLIMMGKVDVQNVLHKKI